MKSFAYLLAALPAAFAAPPTPDCCRNIDWLVQANHGSSYAGAFCTKFLSISTSTVTKCASTTVTGAKVTVTSTATCKTAATTSSTSTVTNTITTSTTTYATATCTPATPYTPPATTAATTSAASATGVEKRNVKYPNEWCWTWDWPYPTPKYNPSSISAACSCIATTPVTTVTSTSTITKPGPTTTTTTTTTITTSTSTVMFTATAVTTTTNTVTSTELRPYQPTGTYVAASNATFDDYNGVDFQRGDLDGGAFCSCKLFDVSVYISNDFLGDADGSGGNCVVRGTNYGLCTGFNSCQDICGSINNNAGSLVCVAATYNGPDASGACYFKQSLEGCGYFNDGRRSGLIELNGYKYASQK